jgi:hypothetical protein
LWVGWRKRERDRGEKKRNCLLILEAKNFSVECAGKRKIGGKKGE